jgi:uncharacterized protein (DUF58 family)
MKWIVGAVVLLLTGLVFELGLLVYAMYVLLGVLIISRVLSQAWIGNIGAARSSSASLLQIGERVRMRVSVRNRGMLPVPWLLLEDALPAGAFESRPARMKIEGEHLAVVKLPPRQRRELSYEVEFLMRGYYQLGPLLVESGDLFGLHRRFRVATEPHFVLVYPKVIPLSAYDLRTHRPVGHLRLTHRLFEDPTRISGVRMYQHGDPLNRVHWRATARTGVLHCKTYEPSCVVGATIVLDFHQNSYRSPGEVYRSELAVTTAASLANALHVLGEQVGLISNGRDAVDRIHEEGWHHEFRTRSDARAEVAMRERSDRLRPVVVPTRRNERQLLDILEALARLELTDGMSLGALIDETGSQMPRDATVVAVIPEAREETVDALAGLRRRGYAVTAVLVLFNEPTHPDWARPPEWEGRLLAADIEVRRITDEASLAELCGGQLVR